jgi:DNA-binding transcriptional regulator PaaX
MTYRALTREILTFLAGTGYALLDGFLPPQYPEAKLARLLLGMDRKRPRAAAKHTLSSTLHRLKKRGLVTCARHKTNAHMQWKITKKGRVFLGRISAFEKESYDLVPEDGIVRIVTFDIPEKIRGKRDWLREQLFACGYHLLQRSVFTGTRPLPDTFIRRADDMKIGRYLHIASLTQTGTMKTSGR